MDVVEGLSFTDSRPFEWASLLNIIITIARDTSFTRSFHIHTEHVTIR